MVYSLSIALKLYLVWWAMSIDPKFFVIAIILFVVGLFSAAMSAIMKFFK